MSAQTEFMPSQSLNGSRRRRRFPDLRWRRAVSPLALLFVWQIVCWNGWVSTRFIPAPSTIAQTFWSMSVSGELARNLLVSLGRSASGLAIGAAIGVVAALIAGLSRNGEDAIDPPMQMMRTLPHLALVPLFILWFGIGEAPKIALVALGSAFPIYLNLYAGIRQVDPKVILPGALPSALVGLRYAIGVAWLSLVVGEQVNASSGIGYLVMNAREFVRTDIIFVGLIVYSLLGLAADALVRKLESAALVWRPATQKP
jgi:sulfonate transport system permease protein